MDLMVLLTSATVAVSFSSSGAVTSARGSIALTPATGATTPNANAKAIALKI